MVRIEARDLEDKELLQKMAAEAKMTEKEFVEKYRYLVE